MTWNFPTSLALASAFTSNRKTFIFYFQAPSVVFIDELDAVGRKRGLIKGSGGQERDATLNQVSHCTTELSNCFLL